MKQSIKDRTTVEEQAARIAAGIAGSVLRSGMQIGKVGPIMVGANLAAVWSKSGLILKELTAQTEDQFEWRYEPSVIDGCLVHTVYFEKRG